MTVALCLTAGSVDARVHRKHHRITAATNSGGGDESISSSGRYAAYVVDAKSGRVLFERNADAPRHPASLTKIMTLYLLFEELEKGRMSMSTPLDVSQHASVQAPSKLGLRPGDQIEVADAIRAIVTRSANDVAVVIAENVSGSEEAFARRMTRTARRLGMRQTAFYNASGLPNNAQITSAHDMVTLGRAIQERFPDNYRFFSTRAFAWRGQVIGNHNRLLGRVDGIDGIKTGYTQASGFNLVSSIRRDGRHLVAAVMGGSSASARDAHMAQLLAANLPQASAGAQVASVNQDQKDDGDDAPDAVAQAPAPAPAPKLVDTKAPVRMASVEPAAQAQVAPAGRPLPYLKHDDGSTAPTRADEPKASSIKIEDKSQPAERGAAVAMVKAMMLPDPNVPPPPAVKKLDEPTKLQIAQVAPKKVEERKVEEPAKPISLASATISAKEVADYMATGSIAKGRKADEAAPRRESARMVATTTVRVGWVIQIGAFDREAQARETLTKAKGDIGKPLTGREPFTEPVAKGSSTLYRARFAGFADSDAANAVCALLKRKDYACLALHQ